MNPQRSWVRLQVVAIYPQSPGPSVANRVLWLRLHMHSYRAACLGLRPLDSLLLSGRISCRTVQASNVARLAWPGLDRVLVFRTASLVHIVGTLGTRDIPSQHPVVFDLQHIKIAFPSGQHSLRHNLRCSLAFAITAMALSCGMQRLRPFLPCGDCSRDIEPSAGACCLFIYLLSSLCFCFSLCIVAVAVPSQVGRNAKPCAGSRRSDRKKVTAYSEDFVAAP